MRPAPPARRALVLMSLLMLLAGCQTVYYQSLEKLGIEKRDILVDRVDEARDAQEDAKEQFENALEQFIAVTDYQGDELEAQYRGLKAEYEDSEAEAQAVRRRIEAVQEVAGDLFAEWELELGEYSNAELRRASRDQLRATRLRYEQLIAAMKRAEAKLDPVLSAFKDRVLFLKHNLNAQAVAALRSDRQAIESDIAALVRDMNASIAEADRFIQDMRSGA